jgi:sulfoxide reductase heme-binding subunit YedZ
MGEHVFWITSRAAGISALLASSAAVALGLLMAGRMINGNRDLRVWHEALSIATMASLAVHAFSLLGDRYLKPSVIDVLVPGFIDSSTFWTALGIVGGWLFVLLGLSYYVRGRIGPRRWRALHRFTSVAWGLGVVHALGAGTDAGAAWFLVAAAMVVIPGVALLIKRFTPELAA